MQMKRNIIAVAVMDMNNIRYRSVICTLGMKQAIDIS